MVYLFGDCEFDPDRHTLHRSGIPVHVEPKVFALLGYLLQHQDRFVAKETLHAHLWPDQYVSESSLAHCVAEARKVIGDTGRAQRLIKTVHGRGYSFIAPVHHRQTSAESQEPSPPEDGVPAHATPPTPLPSASPPPDSMARATPPPVSSPTLQRAATTHQLPMAHVVEAERRQLTVLWCRTVITPWHAQTLDPEDLHHLTQEAYRICSACMQQFEGRVTQHAGDGLVTYFGHPLAHEDDAQRAVRAGLAILKELQPIAAKAQRQRGMHLTVHMGIHTSQVVIAATAHDTGQLPLAVGEAPALAAQLASLAPPMTVLISPATFRLVAGYFPCQLLGEHDLEDAGEGLSWYQVLGEHAARTRLDVAMAEGFTSFIGREHELGLLSERWEQACEGWGQAILVSGEAGIGKSRLIQAFHERLAGTPYLSVTCRCSTYTQHSALHPLFEPLHRWLQWEPDDDAAAKLHKLETALTAWPRQRAETVPLLAALLSLPLPAHYAPLALSPHQQKTQTLDVLQTWLLQATAQQPVCLVVEDFHWVDPSTLAFLDLLMDQLPMARMLVLITCRPDSVPSWVVRSHMIHLALRRFSPQQTTQMVREVTGGKGLPEEVTAQLLAKTHGVPLFIEEMTKMILESGWLKEQHDAYVVAESMPALTIPTTLQGSLMARLDQQGTGKLVAQLGATVGREFSYSLLQAICPLDEATLQRGLAQLVGAEILYQRGFPPKAHYSFKHVLLQEAAYQSLLRTTRQRYHQHIAQLLETQATEDRDAQLEIVAHHWTEARQYNKAVAAWYAAGQCAMGHSAYAEAIAHVQRALALLPALPETPLRAQQTLQCYLLLGVARTATQGYAAPDVEQAYLQARACCQHAAGQDQLFTVLRGLWLVYLVRGELQNAYTYGTQLAQLAQEQSEPTMRMEVHRVLGTSCFFLGNFDAAAAHFAQGSALHVVDHHRALTLRYGQDPGLACLVYTAWILWLQGYPERAMAAVQQALALAQQCAHPFCLAFTHAFMVMLHWYRGDLQGVVEHAAESTTIARTHAFPLFEALGTVFQGSVCVRQGQSAQGIVQMRQGIRAYRATGAEVYMPYFLGLLGEGYGYAGQTEEGLATLTEAFAVLQTTGERPYEAHLYRLQGDLLLQTDGAQAHKAEACFTHALHLARQTGAKALELQSAISLSKLWHRQGKTAAARCLLQDIYAWFTEGLTTGDLREAKALLETF